MPDQGDWLLKMLEHIQRDHKESIAELRLDMGRDFNDVKSLLREQNGRVGRAETRLTIIETERAQEDKQAMRKGTLWGGIAAAGFTAMLEAVKAIWHK